MLSQIQQLLKQVLPSFISFLLNKLANQNDWWSGLTATSNTISLNIQAQTTSTIALNVVCHIVCDAYLKMDYDHGTMELKY